MRDTYPSPCGDTHPSPCAIPTPGIAATLRIDLDSAAEGDRATVPVRHTRPLPALGRRPLPETDHVPRPGNPTFLTVEVRDSTTEVVDALGHVTRLGYDRGPNGIGRRSVMTDATGTTTWQYDAQGRTLTETRVITGAGRFTEGWRYDAAGRVIAAIYPTGEVVCTTYNLRGLPVAVAGRDVYLSGATYNAAGQPVQQRWGNSRRTDYAYAPDTLRLQRLRVSGGLLDLSYSYDDVGNILTIGDGSNGGQVQTFGYDARDRLVTARTNGVGQGQYVETYAYDRMGNIITRTVGGTEIAYTYGRQYGLTLPKPTPPITGDHLIYLPLVARRYDPQRIEQPFAVVATSAGFRAGYDRNGNMLVRVEVSGTERITYTQAWDVENRLHVVTNTVTGDVTRFVYDGDGERVLRVDGSGTTVYVGAVEVHIGKTERTTRTYYFVGGQRIAMREGDALTYLHGDHLGSAFLATDGSGAVVGEMRYTPYGVTRSGALRTDRRYTGQRWEASLGLYDYGARFYSPGLGRFVSADTIVPGAGHPQALNRYAYAVGNPLRYTDPSGRIAEDEVDKANAILNELRQYNVHIKVDWGRVLGIGGDETMWYPGLWHLDELRTVLQAIQDFSQVAGGIEPTRRAIGGAMFVRVREGITAHHGFGYITLADYTFSQNGERASLGPRIAIVHELAHYWDWKSGNLSTKLLNQCGHLSRGLPQREIAPTMYGRTALAENWAESVAGYVYPEYFLMLRKENNPLENFILQIRYRGAELSLVMPGLGPYHYAYLTYQFHLLQEGK